MQAAPGLIIIYVVYILILLTVIGFFVSILRTFLLKMEKKPKAIPKPEVEGLTSYTLHESLQNQILELQATETDHPEHLARFKQLIQFLKESKVTLRAESSMIDHYIIQLEEKPPSDLAQMSNLATIFKWSQTRMKELLGFKV